MNAITRLLSAIVLTLLVSVSAFAAGKVDINRDNGAALAAGLNGIGLATVEKNRDIIVVGSAAPATAAVAAKPSN